MASEARYGPQMPNLDFGGPKEEDGQTDGRTDGRTGIPRVLQDLVLFGATPLLTFDFNKHQLKQDKGTDDHILPVGD